MDIGRSLYTREKQKSKRSQGGGGEEGNQVSLGLPCGRQKCEKLDSEELFLCENIVKISRNRIFFSIMQKIILGHLIDFFKTGPELDTLISRQSGISYSIGLSVYVTKCLLL